VYTVIRLSIDSNDDAIAMFELARSIGLAGGPTFELRGVEMVGALSHDDDWTAHEAALTAFATTYGDRLRAAAGTVRVEADVDPGSVPDDLDYVEVVLGPEAMAALGAAAMSFTVTVYDPTDDTLVASYEAFLREGGEPSEE
jgi:hypothetical protein